MKKYTFLFVLSVLLSTATWTATAGNKDRAGQAGAGQLLINPWGRSAGFHGLNISTVRGIESLHLNPAGLSFVRKTEIAFANTQWLSGSGVMVNALGFGQKLGENGAMGISLMATTMGDIEVTTYENPDGGTGATYRPTMLNIGLSYARAFSNSIHVGFLVRLVNESIQDLSASGAAIDMGIQYVTGPADNFRFGIALRNIGTPLKYKGDGLVYSFTSPGGYQLSTDQRAEKFELPSLLSIGASYDFRMGEKHRLTVLGSFISNSFTKDQFGGGLEYSFKEIFMIRGGYRYEEGTTGNLSLDQRTSAHTGLCGGVSFDFPLKKGYDEATRIGVDYGYRHSSPFNGTHTIGVRLTL